MTDHAQTWAECRRIAAERRRHRIELAAAIIAVLLIGWLTYPN